jgi:SAM-dependent methyltransferase
MGGAGTERGSEPYTPDNLLDRLSARETLELHYRHEAGREATILAGRLPRGGRVVSVGCGWHPGRHLFPAPSWWMIGVDADPGIVESARVSGAVDEAHVGHAGHLDLPPASVDAVLYRLVMHHIAFHGSLEPCFEEAARLLAPGGVLVAIEPGLWHPVGLALQSANRMRLGVAVHGTPDDVPLSPRLLKRSARAAGLVPELHAVTFSWRRLPPGLQRAAQRLDRLGSRRRAAPFGHTLLLLARKPDGRAPGSSSSGA